MLLASTSLLVLYTWSRITLVSVVSLFTHLTQKSHKILSTHPLQTFQRTFFSSTLCINPSFDIITSNRPYISWKKSLDLHQSVSQFEDPRPLLSSENRTDLIFYYAIANPVSNNKAECPGRCRGGP